jgi:ABC-type polysaccharide/polyol phosphate export permease
MAEAGALNESGRHVLGRDAAPASSPLAAAIADIVQGARHWPQWYTLGNLDIKLRFRRSGLGPLWTTVSFAILTAALGFVYSRVLGEDAASYLPYIVLGLFTWTFLATTLQEACDAFVHAEHVLKQLYVDRSTLIYRALWRNLVLLGLNALVVAAALALCRVPLHASALLAIPGLAILCLNLAWAALLLAVATARFRAVSRLVHTALPIAMLVTPVIWRPVTGSLRVLAEANPLYFAVELVRGPILGTPPGPAIWGAALACAFAGSLLAVLVLSASRTRIPYWL